MARLPQQATDFLHHVRLPQRVLKLLPASESSQTFQASSANKRGLSLALDSTLKEGSHNMAVFGLGFLRSVASREAYTHYATCHFAFYNALEWSLDQDKGPAGQVWAQFPELRRAEKLWLDLEEAGVTNAPLPISDATKAYCDSIARAANEDDGARLLGHFYVRYFADLFGGRALGTPTRLAVPGLHHKPHFYYFPVTVESNRRMYIERVYQSLNTEGALLDQALCARIVDEARLAFAHNADIYLERPGIYSGALQGAWRIALGGLRQVAFRRPSTFASSP